MTNPNEELVEKMAEAKWNNQLEEQKFKRWNELDKDYQAIWLDDMRVVLSVILSDISKVAMVCYYCVGTGSTNVSRPEIPCEKCNGTGVVPRNEMKGVENGK